MATPALFLATFQGLLPDLSLQPKCAGTPIIHAFFNSFYLSSLAYGRCMTRVDAPKDKDRFYSCRAPAFIQSSIKLVLA